VAKAVRLRRRAAEDVDGAVGRYLDDAGPEIASRCINAVERSFQQIGRQPHSGSLRFAYELDLPELRVWPLARFPYLVFYVERQHEIDVWRVLHSRRDLPVPLVGDNDEE